ncbi:hypothetical protein GP486_006581, partial [Trichoglossum hirsutum]
MGKNCFAPFPQDPDIEGRGIIGSFITVGWITCATALVASASEDIQWLKERAEDPARFGIESRWAWHILQWLRRSRLLRYKERRRLLCRNFSRRLLVTLCDTQIVTGLAILVAALCQQSTITYYHSELVVAFWNVTLNSYWASRDSSLDMFVNRHLWSVRARIICIWCSVVLGAGFQALVFLRETRHWDSAASGRCFISHDRSTDRSQQFWILGLIVYALFLIFYLVSATNKKMGELVVIADNWVSKRQHTLTKVAEGKGRRIWTRITLVRKLTSVLRYTFLVAWWMLKRFLCIWCVSEKRHGLDVAVYTGLLAWSTYDVWDLKISNQHLLSPSISGGSMGFGQVLSLALLVFILLGILDSYT